MRTGLREISSQTCRPVKKVKKNPDLNRDMRCQTGFEPNIPITGQQRPFFQILLQVFNQHQKTSLPVIGKTSLPALQQIVSNHIATFFIYNAYIRQIIKPQIIELINK